MRKDPSATGGGRRFSPGQLLAISEEVARIGAGVRPHPAVTELVLLAIDPSRAHAYWQVEVMDLNRARRETGRSYSPLVLRAFPLQEREASAPLQEHEVRLLQGSFYLEHLSPGGTYVAELGLLKPDGSLALLARSDPATLAPARPSTRQDTAAIDTRRAPGPSPVLTDLATEVTGAGLQAPLPMPLPMPLTLDRASSPVPDGLIDPASGGVG